MLYGCAWIIQINWHILTLLHRNKHFCGYFFINDFKSSNCFICSGDSSCKNICVNSSFSSLVNCIFSCFNYRYQLVITGSASFRFFPFSALNRASTFCLLFSSIPRKAGLFFQFSNFTPFCNYMQLVIILLGISHYALQLFKC